MAKRKACGDQAVFIALSAEETPGANRAAAAKLGLDLPLVGASEAQLKLLDHALDKIVLPTTLIFDSQGHLSAGLVGAGTEAALDRILPCSSVSKAEGGAP